MGKPKSAWASGNKVSYRYAAAANPGRLSVTGLPYLGDFVVLSLDPQRSVAHLDRHAKRLAAQMRPKHYVAIPFKYGTGLPSRFKPTNEYWFSLVRQTKNREAETFTSNHARSEFLIPISPNTTSSGNGHPSLTTVAPFPFLDCAIDTALGSLKVRVTSTERDRTPVLPLAPKDMAKLRRIRREHMLRLCRIRDAEKVAQQELWPAPPLEARPAPMDQPHDASAMSNPALVDDVKAMATLVSALVDYTGDFDIPVVNIHFDLGVLDAVEDPQDLKREEEELLKIMRDAKERMAKTGMQPRYPKTSLPWDDGILDDIERIAEDSMMALRKMSSSVLSPARAMQRSLRGGWQSLKRFGAQDDSQARHALPPKSARPQSGPSSPPAPTLVQPQRAPSLTPTLVLSYDEAPPSFEAGSPAPTSPRLEPEPNLLPPAPAPAHADLPPSPTVTEELAAEDNLSFTPNAPHADVYPSPSTSPVPPRGHLPSRRVGRTGTDASEESTYRK